MTQDGHIALDIELKEEGYEEGIVDLTTQYFSYSNFVIKSFNIAAIITDRPELAQKSLDLRNSNLN